MPSLADIFASVFGNASPQAEPEQPQAFSLNDLPRNVIDRRRPFAGQIPSLRADYLAEDHLPGEPLDPTPQGPTTRGRVGQMLAWERMKREIRGQGPISQTAMPLGLSHDPSNEAIRGYAADVLGGQDQMKADLLYLARKYPPKV